MGRVQVMIYWEKMGPIEDQIVMSIPGDYSRKSPVGGRLEPHVVSSLIITPQLKSSKAGHQNCTHSQSSPKFDGHVHHQQSKERRERNTWQRIMAASVCSITALVVYSPVHVGSSTTLFYPTSSPWVSPYCLWAARRMSKKKRSMLSMLKWLLIGHGLVPEVICRFASTCLESEKLSNEVTLLNNLLKHGSLTLGHFPV